MDRAVASGLMVLAVTAAVVADPAGPLLLLPKAEEESPDAEAMLETTPEDESEMTSETDADAEPVETAEFAVLSSETESVGVVVGGGSLKVVMDGVSGG